MEITLARGPWVDAIKRYDPNLRVRWSKEKKAWCVDYPAIRPDLLPPPVIWRREGGTGSLVAVKAPHNSERAILYHDKRQAVCYVSNLGPHVLGIVKEADQKYRNLLQRIKEIEAEEKLERQKALATQIHEGAEEGFDRLKHSKLPPLAGAGATIKEERIDVMAKAEQKYQKLLEDA